MCGLFCVSYIKLHNLFLVTEEILCAFKYFSSPYSTDFTSLLIVLFLIRHFSFWNADDADKTDVHGFINLKSCYLFKALALMVADHLSGLVFFNGTEDKAVQQEITPYYSTQDL
jgi:hypothetical protein